nr:hypothetical protein [Tanacetum cinerariifolium]
KFFVGPCKALTARKSVSPLPSYRLVLRYTSHHLDHFTFGSSSSHSSSDHSSSGHSSSGHSLSRHTPLDTTIINSSTPSRFIHPPLARTPRDSSSESSVGPSRKRCMSPAATMTSSIYAMRALVLSRAGLFPPRKRTIGTEALAAYTQRFQELTMMCTKMVLEEEDQVEKFIGGLHDNIQWNVIAAEPMPNVGGQNVARAYTADNNKGKPYNRPLPLCNKSKLHHKGTCTVRCRKCNKVGHLTRDCKVTNSTNFECGRQGHYKSDFPKLTDQNRENKVGNKNGVREARGKAYVLGGGDANPDSNVVKGTLLLNNYYAFVLFDFGADQSFLSTTFSTLLDITLDTLDVSYAVELADGRVSETNTILEAVR